MHLSGPVLVPGGNCFVASWVVKWLLEPGLDVHATVRDPDGPRKTAKLAALARDSPGTLSFFRADLVDREGFDNGRSRAALSVTYSPVAESVVDHFR